MKPPLTIIIPARREEEVIIHTLNELKNRVRTPHEIIVINDSDRLDKTGDIVKEYSKKNKKISVIIKRDSVRPSFANAIILGIQKIKSGFIVPVMADLCDEPETIDVMYKKMQEGWDVVCGSRYMKGGEKEGGPFIQSMLSYLVCMSLHYITRIPTKDVSNAFKMYRKETLDSIIINPESGVEVSMAMILQVYFKNAEITEVPTKWIGRTLGKSKFKIIDRTPPYYKIYSWGVKNALKKMFPKRSY